MKATGVRMDGNSFILNGGYITSTQYEHFSNLIVANSRKDLQQGKVIAGIHGAVEFKINQDQS